MASGYNDDDPVSCLALYGTHNTAEALAEAVEILSAWFERRGHPPTHIHAKTKPGNVKPRSFRTAYPKLKAGGFEGVLELWISNAVEGMDAPYSCWRSAASILRDNYFNYEFAFLGTKGSVPTFEPRLLADVGPALASVLRPAYGIGYCLPFGRGPVFYASGMAVLWARSRHEEVECAEDGSRRWLWHWAGSQGRLYETGRLRDVYPWNLLTEPMLARPVEGLSLRDWIGGSTGRGRLIPWTDDVTLWEIPEAEIPSVRNSLLENDAILWLPIGRVLRRNYLLGTHLWRKMHRGDGIRFKDWVGEKKSRGRLVLEKRLVFKEGENEEIWAWEVEEHDIPEAQTEFFAAQFEI